MVLELLDRTLGPTSKRTQVRPNFHPSSILTTVSPLLTGPPASHSTFAVPSITGDYLRTMGPESFSSKSFRRPDSTLSRLHTVTQSIATPEPDCPGLHSTSSRSSPRPWTCHHTWERTVLSRMSAPRLLNFDRFYQPCLLHGRIPGIGEDCRPRTTWRPRTLVGSPIFPPFRLTGSACHAD